MAEKFLHLIRRVSNGIANAAGQPLAQIAVLSACLIWLLLGQSAAALASTLTIGGFILTQMVLSQQRQRENALHLEIDELILATGEHATSSPVSNGRLKKRSSSFGKNRADRPHTTPMGLAPIIFGCRAERVVM
jgi:low affinity Fe/Cu permease